MTTSFVPRPIYRVKKYAYLAEARDTAQSIAQKFGRPVRDYKDLVAANLAGRKLEPMPLGSPFGSQTFASLAEGEQIKIPAHWPDLVGVVGDAAGGGSAMVPDAILKGITQMIASVNAGSGGAAVPPELMQGVSNAAVQWWTNTQGTTAAAAPSDYVPFITSAIAWVNGPGKQIAADVGPQAVAGFPWGAVLSLLPAKIDPTQIDWEKDTIPGTGGTPWSSMPWDYLAQVGSSLEQIKPGPIPWGDPSVAGVLAAFKSVIDPALQQLNIVVCGINAESHPDGQCYCKPGYTWATATFDANDPNAYNCVPTPVGPTSPPTGTPPAGGGTTPTVTPPAGKPPAGGGTSTTPPATNALTTTTTSPLLIAAGVVAAAALVAGGVALVAMNRPKDEGRPAKERP